MPAQSPYPRLAVFAEVMQRRFGSDAEQIADALWLAQCLPGSAAPPVTVGRLPDAGPAVPERDRVAELSPKGPRDQRGEPGTGLGEVTVGAGTPLPGALPLQRALRPFQRYRPRGLIASKTLDEPATVERSARAGMVLPTFRTDIRREAELQLVMDGSQAMAVWEPMLRQLRDVSERAGVFRRVTVSFLHRGGGTRPRIQTSWSRTGRTRPAEELFDPTGRRVSLLISDGMGPLWQGGALRALLERWIENGPVALVQPLPQRLWSRAALTIQPGTMRRRAGGFRPLEFESEPPRADGGEGPVPPALPVLNPEPAALGTLARLASTSRGLVLGCAGAWLHPSDAAAVPDETRPVEPASPDEALARFERYASPAARQLAMYLSASALLLPVMLLVQRALIPDSGPAVLAEVLNGGLLEPPEAGPAKDKDSNIWFEFVPGVRDLLLKRLTASEAALVLKHCSLYIERHFGAGARNLPAVVVAYLAGSVREPLGGSGPVPGAFARVSENVLRRFEPALAADERGGDGIASLDRYGRGGGALDLMEAVELLRAAGPEARLPLVRALTSAWRAWRDPAYLDETERVAQSMLKNPRLPQEIRAEVSPLLAEALLERARLSAEAGSWYAALADLLRAEEHWRDCLREPRRAEQRIADAAVGFAEVLRLEYRVECAMAAPQGGDRDERRRRLRLLEQAEAALRPVVALWNDEEIPGELALVLGRVLLDQVRAAADPAGSMPGESDGPRLLEAVYGAVGALRTAAASLARTLPPENAEARKALLDLAEALIWQARLADTDHHAGDEAEEVLEQVAERSAAAGDGATRSLALHSLARLHRERAARRTEPERLDKAEAALREALSLLPADAPRRPELLTELGLLLHARDVESGDLADYDEAVRLLREAAERTPAAAPELPVRSLRLAQALLARFHARSHLADAYEAEWVLTQADQLTAEPALSAQINLELGTVRAQHAERSGNSEQWVAAALTFARAADAARLADQPLPAARAHYRHGIVLERIAGPEQALAAYRRARDLWERASAMDAPEAQDTVARIHALDARSRPSELDDG